MTRPEISSETNTETFFETKYFRGGYKDFFSRPNLFETKSLETNSETFFETQIFETDTETFFET